MEKVGAADLRLVSLTLDRPTPRFSELRSLDIYWPSMRDSALRLRAQSLRPRLYFRMDTVRPSGSRSYAWPLEIANALDLSADEVGFLAWTERSEPSSAPRVYVPVALWRLESGPDAVAAGGDDAIRLGLLPGRELDEVYVRVARYDEREDVYVTIQDQKPLRYGYYPGGRLIPVVLERPPGAGLYVVQIGGTLARGGSTSREFWVRWAED